MSLHHLSLKKFGGVFLSLVCLMIGCSGIQDGGANPFHNPDFIDNGNKPEDEDKKPEPDAKYGKLFEMKDDSVYDKYQNSPHVAYYSASWCGWCTKQTPVIEQLAKENPHILFVKVDADGCRGAVRRNNVSGLPTILVKKVRFTGFTTKEKLQAAVNQEFRR